MNVNEQYWTQTNKIPTEEDWIVRVDEIYNDLTILDTPYFLIEIKTDRFRQFVKCKCECGKICYKKAYDVKVGRTKSCGCRSGRFTNGRIRKNLKKAKKDYKICGKCYQELPMQCFFKNINYNDGYCYRCKNCRYEEQLKKYKLSLEDFLKIYQDQLGKCKICSKQLILPNDYAWSTSNEDTVNVDHCHTTGKVRGLLCKQCNIGLGKFSDNIQLLHKAIDYLSN